MLIYSRWMIRFKWVSSHLASEFVISARLSEEGGEATLFVQVVMAAPLQFNRLMSGERCCGLNWTCAFSVFLIGENGQWPVLGGNPMMHCNPFPTVSEKKMTHWHQRVSKIRSQTHNPLQAIRCIDWEQKFCDGCTSAGGGGGIVSRDLLMIRKQEAKLLVAVCSSWNVQKHSVTVSTSCDNQDVKTPCWYKTVRSLCKLERCTRSSRCWEARTILGLLCCDVVLRNSAMWNCALHTWMESSSRSAPEFYFHSDEAKKNQEEESWNDESWNDPEEKNKKNKLNLWVPRSKVPDVKHLLFSDISWLQTVFELLHVWRWH